MNCRSTHFSCDCQRELLADTIDALRDTVVGIEKYIESIAPCDRIMLTVKHDLGLEAARSVLRRAGKIK